jgi:hypothetical protein
MELFSELWAELVAVLSTLLSAAPYIIGYVLLILLMMVIWGGIKKLLTPKKDYGSLKTVTFGDESAVTSNTAASVISIVLIFVLWGAFTGSKLLPGFMHAPGPFVGEGEFSYTITTPAGESDDATVSVLVAALGEEVATPEVDLVRASQRTTLSRLQATATNCCASTEMMRWAAMRIRSSLPSMVNRLYRVGQLTWHLDGSQCRTREP